MPELEGYVKLHATVLLGDRFKQSQYCMNKVILCSRCYDTWFMDPSSDSEAALTCVRIRWLKWYKAKELEAEEAGCSRPSVPLCCANAVFFILMSLVFIGALQLIMSDLIPSISALPGADCYFALQHFVGSNAVTNAELSSDFSANYFKRNVSPFLVKLSPV